ncbi:MAG: hypothetical protein VX044_09430 [Planctomycetota bacterium]|nr:hypothetical protein [Planctomycetota bacterium]
MKPSLGLGLLFALASCDGGAPAPWASPPSLALDLRVEVAPLEVGMLQPVTVTVDRYRARDVQASLQVDFDDEDWVEQARVESGERPLGEGRWQRTVFTLLPLRGPGELRVPSLRVEGSGADEAGAAATSEEVVVLVTSVLSDEHGAEIEPPGGLFATPWSAWWWGGGLLALAAAALFVAVRRRRERPAAPVAVEVPAHVRALRELRRWQDAARESAAEVDAFYVGVSQVLRRYLEERFGLHAPERTTEEFLRDLERGDSLARRHRGELERFLSQCDMVKFAKVVPSPDEHGRAYALAEAFVESTRADRFDASEGPA